MGPGPAGARRKFGSASPHRPAAAAGRGCGAKRRGRGAAFALGVNGTLRFWHLNAKGRGRPCATRMQLIAPDRSERVNRRVWKRDWKCKCMYVALSRLPRGVRGGRACCPRRRGRVLRPRKPGGAAAVRPCLRRIGRHLMCLSDAPGAFSRFDFYLASPQGMQGFASPAAEAADADPTPGLHGGVQRRIRGHARQQSQSAAETIEGGPSWNFFGLALHPQWNAFANVSHPLGGLPGRHGSLLRSAAGRMDALR